MFLSATFTCLLNTNRVTPPLPQQPVPELNKPLCKEIFPSIQSKPPLLQLEATSTCPITCYLGKEISPGYNLHLGSSRGWLGLPWPYHAALWHTSLSVAVTKIYGLFLQLLALRHCSIHTWYTKFCPVPKHPRHRQQVHSSFPPLREPRIPPHCSARGPSLMGHQPSGRRSQVCLLVSLTTSC